VRRTYGEIEVSQTCLLMPDVVRTLVSAAPTLISAFPAPALPPEESVSTRRARVPNAAKFSPSRDFCLHSGAGNPARSRLSGGFLPVASSAEPAESRLQPRLSAPQCAARKLSAVSSRGFAFPPGLEGSRAESLRRAKTLTSSNTISADRTSQEIYAALGKSVCSTSQVTSGVGSLGERSTPYLGSRKRSR
jgi:hypothetical protein